MLARTISDLAGNENIQPQHVEEALLYGPEWATDFECGLNGSGL